MFVSKFVSTMCFRANALHNVNCVTACKSSCYTIYTTLCNAFALAGRFVNVASLRVTFGRRDAFNVSGVRSSGNVICFSAKERPQFIQNTLFWPSIYFPSCCYMLGGPLGATFGRNEVRNRTA